MPEKTAGTRRRGLSTPTGNSHNFQPPMTREATTASFERAGIYHNAVGFPLRPMLKGDYMVLVIHRSPFLWRAEPTLDELAFFLWVLSPQFLAWCLETGWRKSWLGWLQSFEAAWYARQVAAALGRNMPASSERAVVQCFDYLDRLLKPDPDDLLKQRRPPTELERKNQLQFVSARMAAEQRKQNCAKEKIWFSPAGDFFGYLPHLQSRSQP